MVHENNRHRSAGSSRKSSFSTGLRRNSSGSLLSRVLGSFRNKHHGEKGKKTSAQDKGEQQDWMSNYKGTHHPDRPRVDKRAQEMVSDEEYAARLGWIQEKSQRHYGLSDHGGSSQAPVPNFSYSSMSPRSNRISAMSPTSTKTEQLFRDRELSKGTTTTDLGPVSPILPGAGTIRIYNALDRGPIVRYSGGSGKRESPSPRKLSTAGQPSRRRGSRGSMLGEKRTAADVEITNLLNREAKTPIYNGSPTSELTPGLILNSSPTSPSRLHAQKCPWRGCHAVLGTAQERKDNLCTRCHEALYPRESAFFGSSLSAIQDTHLETLHALVGSPTPADAENTQIRTIRRKPAHIGGVKLLPAPRGKRRHIFEARGRVNHDGDSSMDSSSGNETDGSARSPFSSDREQQTSPGTQDAGSFSPLHEGIFGISPGSWGIRSDRGVENDGSHTVDNGDEEEKEEEEETESLSPHTKPPSDKSWTTDTYSTSSSEGPISPYSDPGMETTRDLYPPPLIARIQSGEQVPQPLHQSKTCRSRDSLLYREIEDIIDCYAYPDNTDTDTGVDAEDQERRKDDVLASYFADDPEAVEMRRRGFI